MKDWYFTDIKKTSDKAMRWIDSYNNCTNYNLFDLYKNPSTRKQSIFENLKRDILKENGYKIKILSGNSSFFVLAYRYSEDNKNYLVIVTYCNNYRIEL